MLTAALADSDSRKSCSTLLRKGVGWLLARVLRSKVYTAGVLLLACAAVGYGAAGDSVRLQTAVLERARAAGAYGASTWKQTFVHADLFSKGSYMHKYLAAEFRFFGCARRDATRRHALRASR